MIEIETHVNALLAEARATLTQGKEWHPLVRFIEPDGRASTAPVPHAFMAPAGDDSDPDRWEGKEILARILAQAARESGAIVLFLTDAWVVVAPKQDFETVKERAVTHGLYDHPERREALMLSVFGPGLKPTTYFQFHQCDAATGGITFAPVEKVAETKGRFAPDMSKDAKKA